jgi:hypothetical protein
MNRKRHNEHFLKAKKTRANLKLFRIKGISSPIMSFFHDANVTIDVSVFCEEDLKPY